MKPVQKKKVLTDHTKWNIIRGDMVAVTQGPQSGQQGKVIAVLREKNRLLIEGVNMRRRIVRSQAEGTPHKIQVKPCTIHYSNAALVDPSDGKPTRVARRFLEDGSKVRVSKRTGHIIPKPAYERLIPRSILTGPKDTIEADVFEVTYENYDKLCTRVYGEYDAEDSAQA
jgi:large subunit ribosomal protein L24